METLSIISVTAANVEEWGMYCIKDKKSPGYHAKLDWFKSKINTGLQINMAIDEMSNRLGFIEFISAEAAWRPIIAKNYLFIHCIAVISKENRGQKVAASLLKSCEEVAIKGSKSGVCVMTSNGPWIADKSLFEKNGYSKTDAFGRYELMVKQFDSNNPAPKLINWEKQQDQYKGWNLIYADQCPWHQKSINDLIEKAKEFEIDLKVTRLNNPEEAKNAPSGFGVFSLIKDGKLIEDHYLSKTRFENIIKEELNKND